MTVLALGVMSKELQFCQILFGTLNSHTHRLKRSLPGSIEGPLAAASAAVHRRTHHCENIAIFSLVVASYGAAAPLPSRADIVAKASFKACCDCEGGGGK